MEQFAPATIKSGMLIRDTINEHLLRVLYICSDHIVVCQTGISYLNIFIMSASGMLDCLSNGSYLPISENRNVIDINFLPQNARDRYDIDMELMHHIDKIYGPTYLGLMGHARKEPIVDLTSSSNMAASSIWRKIRIYLQSGCDPTSLVDRRYLLTKDPLHKEPRNYRVKTGRPGSRNAGIIVTELIKNIFEKMLDIYKSHRRTSIRDLFIQMLKMHFSYDAANCAEQHIVRTILPENQRPTINQLRYFINQNMSRKDKEIRRTSIREAENNSRLLKSDSLFHVNGPMDLCQIDACEIDVSLIASINTPVDQIIGRPILYVLQDTYTKMVVSIGVGFENNSVVGLTNCLMNLNDDKCEFCRKYGMEIDPDVWPSNYLPRRIISDRGSEYLSDASMRIFNELNITKELAPAGFGSYKGDVERFFGQFQTRLRTNVEGYGEISKRYDSNHKKNAVLPFDLFMSLLLQEIVAYNSMQIINYPVSRDMLEAGLVTPTPVSLWNYGLERYGSPKSIANSEQFLFTLMTPVKAGITRKGFHFHGLYYTDWGNPALEREIRSNIGKDKKKDFRIDPRDIGSLYFIENNHLRHVSLASELHGNADYAGLTLTEWDVIYKYILQSRRDRVSDELAINVALQECASEIVQSAKMLASDKKDTLNIRAHRWSEQQRTRNENSMFARLAKIVAGQRPEPFLPESNVMELNAKPDVEIQEIQEVEEIENRKTEAEMIEALVSSFS